LISEAGNDNGPRSVGVK